MTCRICFRPKRREYVTALLLSYSGKPFAPEAIAKYAREASLTVDDWHRDLAALPADLAVGRYPATIGLAAARDYLLGVR